MCQSERKSFSTKWHEDERTNLPVENAFNAPLNFFCVLLWASSLWATVDLSATGNYENTCFFCIALCGTVSPFLARGKQNHRILSLIRGNTVQSWGHYLFYQTSSSYRTKKVFHREISIVVKRWKKNFFRLIMENTWKAIKLEMIWWIANANGNLCFSLLF